MTREQEMFLSLYPVVEELNKAKLICLRHPDFTGETALYEHLNCKQCNEITLQKLRSNK